MDAQVTYVWRIWNKTEQKWFYSGHGRKKKHFWTTEKSARLAAMFHCRERYWKPGTKLVVYRFEAVNPTAIFSATKTKDDIEKENLCTES